MSSHEPTTPVLRAWLAYILVYLTCAIPVRLLVTWLATGVWDAEDTAPHRAQWAAQIVSGALLLPVSYYGYRWSVRRLPDRGSEGTEKE